MPITLPLISRRRFLAGSFAAGATLLAEHYALAAPATEVNPNRFALLSDIHIAADKTTKAHGVVMFDNLHQACAEVLQLDKAPARAIVNGDCAYLKGLAGDYATLIDLLRPIREAGIPLHLAMGNHDLRENFWQALPADETRARVLPNRQVLVFETPRANWIMLDSLEKTNFTPGLLGLKQLDWLTKTLDERPGKPAIVMVHHNPMLPESATQPAATQYASTQPATTQPAPAKITGLIDTRPLMDVLLPRTQVKALFFGHTHFWNIRTIQGLHLINLPAVAYVFIPTQPSAWVDAHLQEDSIALELRCLDRAHPWHGQKHDLRWRR